MVVVQERKIRWAISLFLVMLYFSGLTAQAQYGVAFTVTNTSDSGPGSLRKAILDANASAGIDIIAFSIPGPGPHTIQPTSSLPTITDPVIIDGYTQPGASPNTNPPGLGSNAVLMIELDGTNAGAGANGLHITAGNTKVRGLTINRFSTGVVGDPSGVGGRGIVLRTNGGNVIEGNFIGTDVTGTVALGNSTAVLILGGPSNTIGGTTPEARNILSGSTAGCGYGIAILWSSATGTFVQGNFIGTDVTGTVALGNFCAGVNLRTSNNTVGGTTVQARNVISGNGLNGVEIVRPEVNGNLVQGNFIGTDVTGTLPLGNGRGVSIFKAADNTVGGNTVGARNIISGNNLYGVQIFGSLATGNMIQGNLIGTQVDGISLLGNTSSGVFLTSDATDNTIVGTATGAGNTIAFNGGEGVSIESGTGNGILSNFIFSNTGLGIDLSPNGVSRNDPGDADTGANNLQNFPVLTSAVSGGTSTTITIEGALNSTVNTTFRLEFFSNSVCDPSGHGEGENFLGSTMVTTDGSGNASFMVTFPTTVPTGHFITATTTNPDGNISEFSQCIEVEGKGISVTGRLYYSTTLLDGVQVRVDLIPIH